jgi:hypothetical protein
MVNETVEGVAAEPVADETTAQTTSKARKVVGAILGTLGAGALMGI